MWGTSETVLLIGLMVAGYLISGRLARRRVAAAGRAEVPAPAAESSMVQS
ncbi:hypothetical protein OG900_13205 [Streptomyces sp. NBC_00433]